MTWLRGQVAYFLALVSACCGNIICTGVIGGQ